MMTQEIAKILVEEWLKEWLRSFPRNTDELAFDSEYASAEWAVRHFLKWIEANK